MKNLALLLFVLSIIVVGCETAGDPQIVGEWEITEFRIIGPGGDAASNEEKLNNAGAKWDLEFSKNGEFVQTFNMRKRNMEMETEKGTWTTNGDSLKIVLHIDTIKSNLDYTYEINQDTLTLTLAPEISDTKIITKFREK
ncbi:MAG TPA: lipocalin family protein [Prolixibacteraceae bacterium]|nr:lipocalin family protein [Prolixibacteraceae bacterium]